MEIQLTDDYRITSEPRNIVLERRVTPQANSKQTEPYWTQVGYYGRLEDALQAVLDREIEGAPVRDIESLRRFILGVRQDILNAVRSDREAGAALQTALF